MRSTELSRLCAKENFPNRDMIQPVMRLIDEARWTFGWHRRLLLLTLVMAGHAGAQTSRLDAPWSWVRFTTEAGLPDDSVMDMAESEDGTLWVLTARGLAWYDGYAWNPVDTSGVIPPGRMSIAAGKRGIHVLCSRRLFHVDKSGARESSATRDPRMGTIGAIVPLGDGKLLLGRTPEASISFWVYDEETGKLEPFPTEVVIGPFRGPRLWRTKSKTLWTLLETGLARFQDGDWKVVLPCMPGRGLEILCLEENDAGEAWFSVRSPSEMRGLWEWQIGESPRRVPGEDSIHLNSLSAGPNGSVIGISLVGDVLFRTDGVWHWLTRPLPIHGRPLFARFTGKEGDLWIGTEEGLHHHLASDRRWKIWREPGSSHANHILSILVTREGEVWTGTTSGIDVRKPSGKVEHIASAAGVPLQTITGLAQGKDGRIWATSGSGFPGALVWDGKEWKRHEDPDLAPWFIHRVIADDQGRVWFCPLSSTTAFGEGYGPGPLALDEGRIETFGEKLGEKALRTYDVALAKDGTLYFATDRGLFRYRNGVTRRWDQRSGMREQLVYALAISPAGEVWFCHRTHGVGRITSTGMVDYPPRAPYHKPLTPWDLAFDSNGILWVATERGLVCRRDGEWISFQGKRTPTSLPIFRLLAHGKMLYMGSSGGGLIGLRTSDLHESPPRIDPAKPVINETGVHLNWTCYAPGGIPEPGEIETRWRRDGGAWSPWSLRRAVVFSRLSPGRHEFEIQARGLFGERSATEVISLSVPSPLYLRPEFLIPMGILVLALVAVSSIFFVRKKKHDAALRASEQRLAAHLRHTPLAAIVWDREFRVVEWNPAAERIFEFTREEALGRKASELIVPEEARAHVEEVCQQLLEGTGGERSTNANVTKSGRILTCEWYNSTLHDRHGRPIGFSSLALDITEQESLGRQLRQAQKMEAVGRLAGGIAHDFNNILTAILGHVELLHDAIEGRSDADPREEVREIEAAGARAVALTRQLLAFSSRQVMNTMVLNPNEALSRLERMLKRLLRENIQVEFLLSPRAPRIRTEAGQLEQIIVNLAVNASDAMPEGGRLTIRTDLEVLNTDEAARHRGLSPGKHLRIIVEDTGHGMDMETQQRIFEPFFTTKAFGEGTGLGLATVHGIVRRSGGCISIDSKPGRGTRFIIHIPATEDPEESQTPLPGSVAPPQGNETILVCEDEAAVLSLICNALGRNGYEVLAAASGKEALEVVRKRGTGIDLLVTDVIMPGMTGPMLARMLLEEQPDLSVLFVSGYPGQELGRQGIDIGSHSPPELLEKPFRSTDLLRRIRRILDRRKRARQTS